MRWRLMAAVVVAAAPTVACDSAQVSPSTSTFAEPTVGPPASSGSLSTDTTIADSTRAALALERLVAEFVGDQDGGAVALVVRHGVTTTALAGVANASGKKLTVSTPFRVGSISKPFIATIVLQLVDEDRVELDAPLATYLPDTPLGAEVTVRALLSHRSGLPNYTNFEVMGDALDDRSRRFTPADILTSLADIPSQPPGQRFAYSNTNYILLGQLVEHLEATDLNTSLQRRITGPLELADTRFATADEPTPDGVAAGFSPGILQGHDDADYTSFASSAWAAGALVSTVGDLATFLDALVAGALISQASLAEMTTTGPDGNGLGLFDIGLGPSQSGYGHGGEIFGYTALMGIDPDTGDTLVVVTNNDQLVTEQLAINIIDHW